MLVSIGQPEKEEAMNLLDAKCLCGLQHPTLWSLWAIVQAAGGITNSAVGDFDYLTYAIERFKAFRQELTQRGTEW